MTRKELVLGGFSQGGALAYHTAFNHFDEIGGLLIMSSWLCDSEAVLSKYKNGKSLPGPISHHHGDIDPMVPHFMAGTVRSNFRSQMTGILNGGQYDINCDVVW